jgi:tetrahydromethanopterin S-methyltransferase subunit G
MVDDFKNLQDRIEELERRITKGDFSNLQVFRNKT